MSFHLMADGHNKYLSRMMMLLTRYINNVNVVALDFFIKGFYYINLL